MLFSILNIKMLYPVFGYGFLILVLYSSFLKLSFGLIMVLALSVITLSVITLSVIKEVSLKMLLKVLVKGVIGCTLLDLYLA